MEGGWEVRGSATSEKAFTVALLPRRQRAEETGELSSPLTVVLCAQHSGLELKKLRITTQASKLSRL